VTQPRSRGALALAALSLAALVLGHDLIFVLTYGIDVGGALQRTGHGVAWLVTVISAAIVAGSMLALAARRLISLSRLAHDLEHGLVRVRRGSSGELGREIFRLWVPILVTSLVLFVVNENLERAAIGLQLPGLGIVIGSGHAPAVLIFAAVSLFVAGFAGLYRWRRDLLHARAIAARARWANPGPSRLPPRRWADQRPPSIFGRRLAVRAPPFSIGPAHS
jgi:hypothetical protein